MPESLGAQRAYIVLATICAGTVSVGGLILVGGPARFSSASFDTARQVAPCWVWGTYLLGSGLLALVGIMTRHPWLCRVGHMASAFGYGFLVTAFITVSVHAPTVALTGIGVYGALAVAHAIGAATADMTPRPLPEPHRLGRPGRKGGADG